MPAMDNCEQSFQESDSYYPKGAQLSNEDEARLSAIMQEHKDVEHSLPSADEARLQALLRDVEMVERMNESSLPSAEEVRFNRLLSGYNNVHSGKRKRIALFSAIACIAIAAIITLSILIAQSNNSSPSSIVGPQSNAPFDFGDEDDSKVVESRLSEVQRLLAKNGISTLSTLEDQGKPQYHAAKWIADHDAMKLALPTLNADSQTFVERYVMAVFYFALRGSNWHNKLKFLTVRSVCDWHFAMTLREGAQKRRVEFGVQCDESMSVVNIFISKFVHTG